MGAPIPDDVRLKGPFKPMRFEAVVEDCIVSQGEIPDDLAGGFYRVGPTWKRPSKQGSSSLLSMDGMVQALVFEDGKATFRNRWIRTPKYQLEAAHGRGMFDYSDGDFNDYRSWGYGEVRRDQYTGGVPQGTNNVNIFPFAGQVLASGEQGSPPIALDPVTLETRGIVSWSPHLSEGVVPKASFGDAAFTAHPKWDGDTGELFGWAYRDTPPYVTLHKVSPEGGVVSMELWDAPYNTVAHDMWLTPEYIVMPFQPFIISQDRVRNGQGVFGWNPELPIVIGLIPRDLQGHARFIETDMEPEYIMHTLSANVVGDTLTLDAPIFDRPPFPFEFDASDGEAVPLFFSLAKSTLGRWTIDLVTGRAKSERLSDRPSELPKVDERYYGRGYEWGFLIAGDPKRSGMSMKTLLVQNVKTLQEQEYRIRRDGDLPSAVLEATFVPRHAGSAEGDGYLVVPHSKWAENLGEYLIFDTQDITQGPICTIDIPFRLGWTAHGHWMDFR